MNKFQVSPGAGLRLKIPCPECGYGYGSLAIQNRVKSYRCGNCRHSWTNPAKEVAMSEPTKRPLKLGRVTDGAMVVSNTQIMRGYEVFAQACERNAKEIVTCVNMHDRLVAVRDVAKLITTNLDYVDGMSFDQMIFTLEKIQTMLESALADAEVTNV